MAAAMGNNLASPALALVADGKGILAADETSPTLTKRNAASVYSDEIERGFRRGGVPVPPGEDD
jgi:fructose-bisphosphate aldolase class 1